jgi:hypothetical protein
MKLSIECLGGTRARRAGHTILPRSRHAAQSQWVIASHMENYFSDGVGEDPPTLRYGTASEDDWAGRPVSGALTRRRHEEVVASFGEIDG